MAFKTEQEEFWAGDFGNDYIGRNKSDELLGLNLNFFSKAFGQIEKPDSLVEFGANVGMNLRAIRLLFPGIALSGVEINEQAATELSKFIGAENVFQGSMFDYEIKRQFDVSMIKGVLIHTNPDMLPKIYEKLYHSSKKYILLAEYYNPEPVAISYRGHNDRLFKRDFAGEMLDTYTGLELIDYGFIYRKDKAFPQDDVTWFLLKKT